MAVGDRVWLQIVGPKNPGIYYVATIVSETYKHPVLPRWPPGRNRASNPSRYSWHVAATALP
jgi:hypothetical protein